MIRRLQGAILVYVFGLSHCIQGQVSGLSYPVAFYPFNNNHKASDISCYSNKQGRVVGAQLTTGPNGEPNSAYDFAANKTNYIEIPGTSYTDTRYSMTIVLWVYHSGFSGPIVDYASDGLGVNLWMTGKDTLYGRIISRDGNVNQFLSSNRIGLQYSWHYVGISYDYSTGNAKLWVNDLKVKEAEVGNIELKTVGLIRLGALDTDDRYFRGKISCLQIYDTSLTASEILVAKNRCKNPGRFGKDCTKQRNTECGGMVSSESGTITSPRYPIEYPPNTKCIWKLEMPKGKRIIIRFRNIDLEKETTCGDYIEVYDGFNTWSTRLVKYCKSPTDKPFDFSSKSNKMKIVFKSNSNNHGKGFSASYVSEEQEKPATKEGSTDLSVHYTGIVIGVACAALLAALTIIAINHNRQSRRRRSSTMSSRRSRRSDSFSYPDPNVPGEPPRYEIVMRCPELYPPSPQMTPVPSTGSSTPVRDIRFTTRQHRLSPLASSGSSRYISNSSSDDSDREDPPPKYPGFVADFTKLQQQINQLASEAQKNTNSQTLSSTDNGDSHPTDSSSSVSRENCSQSINHSTPGTEQENDEHLQEKLENELQSTSCENLDSTEQSSAENQEQCICSILDYNGRERVNTQSSIVGTVV